MALVPVETTQSVEPTATPPDDYARLQSSPANFGGLIAQGAERLGQGAEQAGNAGLDIATMRAQRFNQIQVDDKFNEFQSEVNRQTYGDPNDPTAPQGLYAVKGADALRLGPGVIQSLSQKRDEFKNQLTSDAAKLQFDEQSRRLLQYASGEISRHLDAQADTYGIATNTASLDVAASSAANAWNSNDALLHGQADGINAVTKKYQIQFGQNLSPDLQQKARMEASDKVIGDTVLAASQHDAGYAQKILQTHESELSPEMRVRLQQHLLTVGDQASANNIVNNAMGIAGGGGATSIADAIHGQESGGRATSPTSVNGAQGGWQITLPTFMRYAQPGEQISNPADNEAVGRRIVADFSQKYPNDPARVAVGYFSGEGNVAPPGSPTPWIADKKDGNGTSVSSYVSGVVGRLGGNGSAAPTGATPAAYIPGATPQNTAAPLPDYQTAAAAVMAATAGNYRQSQMAMAELDRRYAAQKRGAAEAYEKAANPLVSQMIADPTKIDPVKDIAQNPAFNAEQKNNLDNMLKKHLADQATEGGDADVKRYGPGFNGYYKAVTADPGDPGRITDPQVLIKAVTEPNGLSVAGMEKLTSLMRDRRSLEGENLNGLQKTLFAAARQQLVAPDFLGQRDPKGEERFLQFQLSVFSTLERAQKAGEPLQDYYDQKSPKYLGRKIEALRRTPAEVQADMAAESARFAPPAPTQPASGPGFFGGLFTAPPAPDLSSVDKITQAYVSGKLGYGPAALQAAYVARAKLGVAEAGAASTAKRDGEP
jgi:hypothetical protein